MANKFFMMAAVASVGCIAFAAPENWFNGGLGSESASVSGGAWQNATQTGVTTENYKYVLDEPENPLAFAATDAKLPEGTNLTFTTTANFKYSYDELPAVDADAKAGVVVYTNRFYVLGKDGNNPSNIWQKTTIDAGTVDGEISVAVVVTNGNNKVFATYTIGTPGVAFNTEVYVKSDAKSWNTVSYKGCGVVASLAGQYEQLGYPCPGGKTIPGDKANAWASKNYPGLTDAQIAAMLASNTEYNGRTAAESCILGVKTNDVITASVADTNAAIVTIAVNCTPISGRATFALKTNGGTAGEAQNSPTFDIPLANGTYSIVAYVDGANKEISVSQNIGVKSQSVESGKVKYIAVPFEGCTVTELLKKSCCSAGDKLEYYSADNNVYYSWTLTDGNWAYDGVAPTITLLKGEALKYTSAGGDTLWAIGEATDTKTTTLKTGAKWNLIAHPNGVAIAAKDLPIANIGEKIVVLGDTGVTPAKVYRNINGTKVEMAGYNAKPYAVTNESASVTGGFFFQTTQGSITWPEETK